IVLTPSGGRIMLKSRRLYWPAGVVAIAVAGSVQFVQGRSCAVQGTAAGAGSQARPAPSAAGHLTTPKEEWGHNIGDDYFLANYQQLVAYWQKLEQQYTRLHVLDIRR